MEGFPTGWRNDPAETDRMTELLAAAGPVLPRDVPGLKGYAQEQISRGVICVLGFDTERKALGDVAPVKTQIRGTCTDQSGSYALTASYAAEVGLGRIVGVPKLIPSGPGYALTWRHSPGQYGGTHPYSCRCGRCPDGENIGHYAYSAAKNGVIFAGVYGPYDLTKDREDLAIEWARTGVPKEILEAASQFTVQAYRPTTIDELDDCLFARYFGHQGFNGTFDGYDGWYAEMRSLGAHAEAVLGIFVDDAGEIGYVRRNSWNGIPKGPYELRLRDGRRVPLPIGYYPVRRKRMKQVLAAGETWVYRVKNGPRV